MPIFNTGDSLPDNPVLYRLLFPNNGWLVDNFLAALVLLSNPENWGVAGNTTIDDALEQVSQVMLTFEKGGNLIGSIVPYMGTDASIPYGFLPCDGASHNRVDYPVLYALLDPVFILDADTFVTPDLRGRTVLGVGQGTGLSNRAMGDVLGAETHTLVTAETPSHSHVDTGHVHSDGIAAPTAITIGAGVPAPSAIPAVAVTGIGNASLSSSGSDGAHNNMQPSLALSYLVVAL